MLFAYGALEGDSDTEEKERRDLQKKKRAFAKRLLNGLHGEAWRCCQDLITDMAKLSEEDGYKHIFSCLQSIEKVTVVKKTEQFDRFFEKGFRKRGQALDAYIRTRRQDWADLQDLDSETKMSPDLLAYFILKQSGLSKDDRRQILLSTGSKYDLDSIESAMRVSYYDIHEREKSRFPENPRKGHGKGKKHYAHMVEDENAPDDDVASKFEADSVYDQASAYDQASEYDQSHDYEAEHGYEAVADESPASDMGASEDEEVYQAFATMDKQRRSYKESRKRLREVQKQRGFFKGELTFEQRKAAVAKEKERTQHVGGLDIGQAIVNARRTSPLDLRRARASPRRSLRPAKPTTPLQSPCSSPWTT